MLAILFMPFGFIATKTLNYLGFQSADFERTRWRLFQKRVVRTTFDIYVLIYVLGLVFFDRSLKHNGTYTQNNFELQVSGKA
jgi:hypothetical protein